MPLTDFQSEISKLLAKNRTEDSYLAGGAAINFEPNSIRYSQDIDYFHDTEERVASAFKDDKELLTRHNYECTTQMNQPGYIRAIIQKSKDQTKIEWSHDSAWRFMPIQYHKDLGYYLHPIDSAINKVLAMAGRDEPRDYLDVHNSIDTMLSLGALCWAASGKDPGFSPLSLLELLRRRGKYRPEDFLRLKLNKSFDIQTLKKKWLKHLEDAETFIKNCPKELAGCLFYSQEEKTFISPKNKIEFKKTIPHFGQVGGVLPRLFH